MRRIEVPIDTPTEVEIGDTAADIQRREKREHREMEEAEKYQKEERK